MQHVKTLLISNIVFGQYIFQYIKDHLWPVYLRSLSLWCGICFFFSHRDKYYASMISATVSFPWFERLYSLLGRGLGKAYVPCTFFRRKREEVRKDLVTLCQPTVNLSTEPAIQHLPSSRPRAVGDLDQSACGLNLRLLCSC